MRLVVRGELGDTVTLDARDDMEIENLKALLEIESGLPSEHITLFYNGVALSDDKKTLNEYNVGEGGILTYEVKGRGNVDNPSSLTSSSVPQLNFGAIQVPQGQPRLAGLAGSDGAASQATLQSNFPQTAANVGQLDWGSISIPADVRQQQMLRSGNEAEMMRQMFLNDPRRLALLKERNPTLADTLNDPQNFARVLDEQHRSVAEERLKTVRAMNADMFDADAQQHIEELIQRKNIDENMENAVEYNPETFGQVNMLYINCKVNGHPVKAFVDSGAQHTIMSERCAHRCNVMRLVDKRFRGVAVGVGKQEIIGRIHMVDIQIERDYLSSAFSVLKDQPMDMLLGLDMLKRHQHYTISDFNCKFACSLLANSQSWESKCCIDLKANVLNIGTTGSSTSFLPESELPSHARLMSAMQGGAEGTSSGSGNTDEGMFNIEDKDVAEAVTRSMKEK